MEKNVKKSMCLYRELNHSAVHQKLTRHCKSTILQLKKKEERSEFPNYMKNTHQALLRTSWGLREGSKQRWLIYMTHWHPWLQHLMGTGDQQMSWKELSFRCKGGIHKPSLQPAAQIQLCQEEKLLVFYSWSCHTEHPWARWLGKGE